MLAQAGGQRLIDLARRIGGIGQDGCGGGHLPEYLEFNLLVLECMVEEMRLRFLSQREARSAADHDQRPRSTKAPATAFRTLNPPTP